MEASVEHVSPALEPQNGEINLHKGVSFMLTFSVSKNIMFLLSILISNYSHGNFLMMKSELYCVLKVETS